MAIFNIENNKLSVDDGDIGTFESSLIQRLWVLFEEHGFDFDAVSTGVMPSPDFGYFQLADRFWNCSLSVLFAGYSGCFPGEGIGWVEPWLFNMRHAFELYVKGCLMRTYWYVSIGKNALTSGSVSEVNEIPNRHDIMKIYCDYVDRQHKVNEDWDTALFGKMPDLEYLVLSERGSRILSELIEIDSDSFRFRYPSQRISSSQFYQTKQHAMQKLSWVWDENKLLPETGLPICSGVFFHHTKALNALHDLKREFEKIVNWHDAIWDSVGEAQDMLREWSDFGDY